MYGKIFKRMFTGSMMGAGAHVIAVMSFVIAHTVKSRVELNPKHLAAAIGDTEENMRLAIEYLCRPDPISTHPENDGSRLVKEGPFQYFVPQHELYKSIQDNDQLRESNRLRQIKCREKKAIKKGKRKPCVMDGVEVEVRQHEKGFLDENGVWIKSPEPATNGESQP